MAQYLTYDEYQAYGGTVPESEFAVAEFRARSRIDWMTLGRIQNMAVVPEEVKLAMMVVMAIDAKYGPEVQAKTNSVISSFSTDGYSESYGSLTEQYEATNKQVTQTVERMLFGVLDDEGVPLIYKGLS